MKSNIEVGRFDYMTYAGENVTVKDLKDEIFVLRAALRFYADESNWLPAGKDRESFVQMDEGLTARVALGSEDEGV